MSAVAQHRTRLFPLFPYRTDAAEAKASVIYPVVEHTVNLQRRLQSIWTAEVKVILHKLGLPPTVGSWRRVTEENDRLDGPSVFYLDRGTAEEIKLFTLSLGVRSVRWRGRRIPTLCAIICYLTNLQQIEPRAASLSADAHALIGRLRQELEHEDIKLNVALVDDEVVRLIVDFRRDDPSPKHKEWIVRRIQRALLSLPQRVQVHSLTPRVVHSHILRPKVHC